MDEVLRELEVGKALSLLRMSSSALFPLWQRGDTVQHGKLCPLLVILGALCAAHVCAGRGEVGTIRRALTALGRV